jgi:hypothetical protein
MTEKKWESDHFPYKFERSLTLAQSDTRCKLPTSHTQYWRCCRYFFYKSERRSFLAQSDTRCKSLIHIHNIDVVAGLFFTLREISHTAGTYSLIFFGQNRTFRVINIWARDRRDKISIRQAQQTFSDYLGIYNYSWFFRETFPQPITNIYI